MKFGSGQSVRRIEDIRFVTGHGQYRDDLHFDRETFVAFVRSPQAHAKINSIDISAAKSSPGVVAVLTQDDIVAAGGQAISSMTPMLSRDGSMPKAVDKVLACQGPHHILRRSHRDGDRRNLRAGLRRRRTRRRRLRTASGGRHVERCTERPSDLGSNPQQRML